MENKEKPTEGARSKAYDIEVNKRFFIIMERLIAMGKIKNMFNFCSNHDLLYPNYHRMRKENTRTPSFYVLNLLGEKYGISVQWILTGKGDWLAKR